MREVFGEILEKTNSNDFWVIALFYVLDIANAISRKYKC